MIDRRAEVILLCEDKAHQSFFRRLLKKHFGFQRIREVALPAGEKGGSGEQHVRNNYPAEVKVVRKGHVTRFLVTVIDADKEPFEKHYNELNAELKKAGENIRCESDRIAIFIPMQNIETWIVCLSKKVKVYEDKDYKHEVHEGDLSKAVELFYSWAVDEKMRPSYCPDSLTRAFPEVEPLRR